MTILFAGGEDTSFIIIGGVQWSTGPGGTMMRSTYARLAAAIQNSGAPDPPTNQRIQTPTFTPSPTLWVHAMCCNGDSTSNFATNQQVMIARSPDGVSRVILRSSATRNILKLATRSAAGVITDVATATTAFPNIQSGPTQVDWLINFATGSTLYFGGAAALTYAGDLRTDAATTLNQVDFANMNYNFWGDYWSEVIVADEDTRSMCLWTLAPQAAGNTQSWTPNTVGNINELSNSDATIISATANNSLCEWTVPTTPPSGAWAVRAIVQEARVQAAATGPQHFDWLVRTGGTDYLAGAPIAPALALTTYSNRLWTINPRTGVAWLVSDITAAGFNLGIESQA